MSEPRERSRVRVLVLTAAVADGHLAAARVLAEEIPRRNERADVIVRDALPALPRPVRWLLKDAYRWQLRNAPWLFALVFAGLRRSRVLRSLSRATLSLVCSRAIARVVRANPSDVIVSTWLPTTQILGCLRLRGKIRIPVCATITDFAGVELWADKGVDVHLVMHESLVAGVERVAGRGSAKTVSPLVSSAFFEPRRSTDARRVLGLPAEGTVIVVSGGGWAVGDLRRAIEAALEIDDSVVVCLAGRDAKRHAQLAGAFAHEPRVIVLGFTDRMRDLLAAADGLVHSTGGVTCLEALVRGCPIVAYGAPSGHGPLLAKRMSALGLLRYARSSVELRAARSSLGRPAALLPRGVDAASLVLGVVPRVAARRRSRLARPMASALGGVVLLFGIMASDITYPVVAEALALPESTSIASKRHAIALVVHGRRRDLLAFAPIARRARLRASIAVEGSLGARDVAVLRAAGLDPIPELRGEGVRSWFDVSAQVAEQAARYGLAEPFYLLAPREGFTLGDYLLARHLGGRPIQPGCVLESCASRDARELHRGEVVAATLEAGSGDRARLLAEIDRLERAGLAITSVRELALGVPPS